MPAHPGDLELAPFYCPDCGLNYCRADWDTFPIFDHSFYDCTIGISPTATGTRSMTETNPSSGGLTCVYAA